MPRDLVRYDVVGHTHFWTLSCYRRLTFFWHDELKWHVVRALDYIRTRYEICLIGYVVMPEHVHVLLYPHPRGSAKPLPVSVLLAAFKRQVGYHGKRQLKSLFASSGSLWSEPMQRWARAEFDKGSIWHKRGHDFNVFTQRKLLEKLDYCHKNPMTRGLVEHAADWPFSSYRYYEYDDRSVLAMDWDGSWPIEW